MAQQINLLPWRETRRRQSLRMGGLLVAAMALSIIALTIATRTLRQIDVAQQVMRTQADHLLYSALLQREREMREEIQRGERQARQAQRRAEMQAWQTRLLTLASLLPEPLWLTRLDYQPQGITLSGLALNLKAVAALEKALGKLEGFQPAMAGGTHRDTQGRWSFSFFLPGDIADADSD
ncbi:TPA: PilN domain-containing protein [Klebsiella aerogenes]|uniref:PilN domain-containing protein n=1 Tax=Klebsiella TaxID=570 RepID=UPI00277CAF5B|nr:PilN domain-containing protein [Klebsiella sp. 141203]MDU9366430.1 PilN domain-containing protein [Klebsiella sp. 141203]HDS7116648.1 PilN domain-containing protein [Klebsiella aerogenes]HDT5518309.1 PilN domain-containing protein [Klebsiella aerogenes]HEP0587504.1 PilN domain-containing protein [Klebsiella aerogenes]